MNTVVDLPFEQETREAGRPLGVALLGIDHGLENTLRFFFSARCRNRFYIEPDASHADIVIIDYDSKKGNKLWALHSERNPHRPIILLSLNETEIEGAELVSKPLRVTALQSALDSGRKQLRQQRQRKPHRLVLKALPATQKNLSRPAARAETPQTALHSSEAESASIEASTSVSKTHKNSVFHKAGIRLDEKEVHAFIGTAPDIHAANLQQLQRAQYDPRKFLVGQVLCAFHSAKEKNRPFCLKNAQGSLTLFPGDRRVVVWMQERHLHSLAALPMDEGHLSIFELDLGPNSDLDSCDSQYDLDAFVWKHTLSACRGRFPLGTDPYAPVLLKRWPNLTRLQLFPNAMRIAALWLRQSHSLLETAEILAIPQRSVFAFYSAAHVLGLATTAPRKGDAVPAEPHPVRKHMKRSLMSRILQHLRIH